MKDFLVKIKSIPSKFTKIPIPESSGQLCMRYDGVVYDGFLYCWEEIEYIKIYRSKQKRKKGTK